jgi:hypothetical protein
MRPIFIKNNTAGVKTWIKDFTAGEEYQIPNPAMRQEYSECESLLSAITSGDALVGDGDEYFSSTSEQLAWLMEVDTDPRDSEGCKIQRQKFNPSGWHFEPRVMKFCSGLAGSLHNKKFDGNTLDTCTDIGDVTLKFYDDDGAELVQGEQESDQDYQTRLTSDCTKTVCDWHATYDQEIISAMFNVKEAPTSGRAYAWCIIAPDISAQYGGSVPFIQGGIDLSYAAEKCCVKIDGRVSKRLNYDPTYKSNKIRLMVLHDTGVHVHLQILFEHFRA